MKLTHKTLWKAGDRVLHQIKQTPVGVVARVYEGLSETAVYVAWHAGEPAVRESEAYLVAAAQAVRVIEIGFDEILPVWRDQLWPNRRSEIRPTSTMTMQAGVYDLRLKQAHAHFWGAYVRGKLIGVNSGFRTADNGFRSRGLWVDPAYAGCGAGRRLMQATERMARFYRADTLWSIPRQSAMGFYEACGYVRSSDWFADGMEFGPNAYAVKSLAADEQAQPPVEAVGGHLDMVGVMGGHVVEALDMRLLAEEAFEDGADQLTRHA